MSLKPFFYRFCIDIDFVIGLVLIGVVVLLKELVVNLKALGFKKALANVLGRAKAFFSKKTILLVLGLVFGEGFLFWLMWNRWWLIFASSMRYLILILVVMRIVGFKPGKVFSWLSKRKTAKPGILEKPKKAVFGQKKGVIKKVGVVVLILVLAGGGWVIYNYFQNRAAKGCQPLTPRLLEKYENASGYRPLLGEKCRLNKKDYFLRILYSSSREAYAAARTLAKGTKGYHREYKGLDLVDYKGAVKALFFAEGSKVGVVVLHGVRTHNRMDKRFEKILDNEWREESGYLELSSGVEVEEEPEEEKRLPTATPTLKPTPTVVKKQSSTKKIVDETKEILKVARRYADQYTAPDLKFETKLLKKLDEYALVDLVPEPGTADPMAVVLQKIGGRWVGIDMGVFFPELREKVPELFE